MLQDTSNRPLGAVDREFLYIFAFVWDLLGGPALVPSDSPSNSMHFALLDVSVAGFWGFLRFYVILLYFGPKTLCGVHTAHLCGVHTAHCVVSTLCGVHTMAILC